MLSNSIDSIVEAGPAMHRVISRSVSVGLLAFWGMWISCAQAQTAVRIAIATQADIAQGEAPAWWSPSLPADVERDVTKKGQRLASQLEINDESKTNAVASLLTQHFGRVWAWHAKVDATLDEAWKAWDAARDNTPGKQKDELRALLVWTERIEPIYAEFTPQVHFLLAELNAAIGAEKTTQLLDSITRSPGAKRTYDAYVAMIPEMKDDEKSILWRRMVEAREASLAAWSDKQIVKLFKVYKVRNELSIDHFGYDYVTRYKAWASQSAR
jgi:hypothetical protein